MKPGDSVSFFELEAQIGEGGFGGVWMVKSTEDDKMYAMKLEPKSAKKQTLSWESTVIKKLQNCDRFPKFILDGIEGSNNFLIMELFGPNLFTIANSFPEHIPYEYLPYLLIDMLTILEQFHAHGYVHRDIKPHNFVTRISGKSGLCLIDFGISKTYVDSSGSHLAARDHAGAVGSSLYSSPSMHEHAELSRRDDLYSLLVSILDIAKLPIPWRGNPTVSEVLRLKKENPLSSLVAPLGDAFVSVAKHVESLGFSDVPNYSEMRQQLLAVVNGYNRYVWYDIKPEKEITPLKDANHDPNGFLISLAPYLIPKEKGGCLLI